MDRQQSSDSLISYLAAVAPALLQLLAVLSVGLVNILKLDQFVLIPNFINLANFLVILLSISIISLSSFWDYNKFNLLKEGENIFSQTKKFWRLLRICCLISVMGGVFFVGIVINKPNITASLEIWAFLQWFSYITFMTSISFVIYAFALLKIQEKKNRNLVENYIPRLIDSLRRYGHVKDPDIVILKVDRVNCQATVKLGRSSKYLVTTDFTGEMTSIEVSK
ncbi:hypothetical protein A2982_04140 [candidate division WWE3 bacterium RIFCSPLOWO2_01_FULL_39_13]|uniref:Uncharacterized protein n=1 Tax=candidate division WWE3 bacterium RIFCSPLOWO2_01_FULL_39_13 TaxID=1802624 RepID=A0A1F4V250_UNCKA|nr:MAG: hypothetical protein A2982_04140 [candidate division WWE3 bacterium RIFCSPLOWO2_01_FULL_39_13]